MTCPACRAIETQFDAKRAHRELQRYRSKGLDRSTRHLLEAITEAGAAGATVLDVGGGVGALACELLGAGAARATIVDASEASLEAARAEGLRRGVGDRLELIRGDFVALAADVATADIAALDKVVCCFPDMEALVDRSVEHAERLYGIVYPRDAWWTRWWVSTENLLRELGGCGFRAYVHSTREIERRIAAAGLTLRRRRRGLVWVVDLYERRSEGS